MAATGFVQRIKGKQLYSAACATPFGAGGALFRNDGNVYQNQSAGATGIAQLTNTTSEVTLDSFSLPANSLDVPGRALNITAFGTFGNSNTHSKSASVYFGPTLKVTANSALTGVMGWAVQMVVIKDAANSQVINGQSISGPSGGGVVGNSCTTQSGSETDTAAITIKVTGQTQTAATGDVILSGWQIDAMD